jgi:hypothetical protein
MASAEIAAVPIAEGDCLEYRTRHTLPDAPSLVCTVQSVLPNGTLVLHDGTYLHRAGLTWLRPHLVEMSHDHVAAEERPKAEPPAGKPPRKAAKGRGCRLSDETRARYEDACRRIRDLQLGGLSRPHAIAQVAREPACAGLKINPATIAWWSARMRAAGKLGPRLFGGKRRTPTNEGGAPRCVHAPPAAAPALVALPPPNGADEPPARDLPPPATRDLLPGATATTLASGLADLRRRLQRHADRLLPAIHLVDAASRALAVLDAYPLGEE